MDAPLISLAVIARDEASALPRLLDAHRGLWDEAVVIDTGSRDGTGEAARQAGARVADFAWCDDFSAARNAALALCRGRWILVLDADEHLAREQQATLRAQVAVSSPSGLLLPQWNYTDDAGLPGWRPLDPAAATDAGGASGYVVAHQVRLFPGGTGIRYRGRIHESVDADLLAQGLPVLPVPVPVHHHGHRADAPALAARWARDGHLLRLKLQESPADPRARFEMGAQLLREQRPDLARRLLERLVAEAPEGPRTPDAHQLLARLALAENRAADARSACAAAVGARPDSADLWLDLVRVRWLTGDQAGARQALAQLTRLFPADRRVEALTAQVLGPAVDNADERTGRA